MSTGVTHRTGYVYILQNGDTNVFKVGKAVDLQKRLRTLGTGNPEPLNEFDVIETEHYSQCETYLHHRLRSRKVTRGEGNEWFEIDPDELAELIEDARNYVDEVLPLMAEAERLGGADCDDRILLPTETEWETYRALVKVREKYETLEFDVRRLEARLKLAIGTAAGMEKVATWKSISQTRFDADAFGREHPDLYGAFLRESRHRTFRLL